MTLLRTINRYLTRLEFGFLVLFLGSMVLLSFLQVVLRNIFGTGIVWADTIIRHLVLWAGFTGAALATMEERHISIDALTKFFSPRVKRISHIITWLFAIVICFFLADASWTFVMDERVAGGELVLSIPTWVAILVIPVGYVLLAFHFLVKMLEDVFTPLKQPEKAA